MQNPASSGIQSPQRGSRGLVTAPHSWTGHPPTAHTALCARSPSMPPPPPPTLLGSPWPGAQSCSRNLGLHLPDSPQPGGLHLCSPWRKERGLVCESRPGLAAQQGGVSQIREAAPNPACWVLQGSEPLIMNLIKGEQEPQSDLGVFSLTSSSAQMASAPGRAGGVPGLLLCQGSRVGRG